MKLLINLIKKIRQIVSTKTFTHFLDSYLHDCLNKFSTESMANEVIFMHETFVF